MLNGKKILLGLTGGIAVYKGCEIVSQLKKKGAEIDVIMTKSATEFVKPYTFQSLTNNPVITNMFDTPKYWDMEHISLAQKSDLILIAPATANIIGKIANGIADDMLSTTVMASDKQVFIAPAMNTKMYDNKIVQANIKKLKELGYIFIEPKEGILACGDKGKGKLQDVDIIVENIISFLENQKKPKKISKLKNKNVLITAGPTIEAIDPVRFIANRSSGKMGYSLARDLVELGANVTLITGPTNLNKPNGLKNLIEVKSTDDMYKQVMKNKDESDIIIKSAAVADYRLDKTFDNKIKKEEDNLTLNLVKNKDILKELGKDKKNIFLVGFAAETENFIENAKNKIKNKNLDLIVLNNVKREDIGFDKDDNEVYIIDKRYKSKKIDKANKSIISKKIIEAIEENI